MLKQYYPDAFTTQLEGNAMTVTSKEGEVLAAYDIKHLADELLLGRKNRLDWSERAMVGACLLHLIAMGKAETATKKADRIDADANFSAGYEGVKSSS